MRTKNVSFSVPKSLAVLSLLLGVCFTSSLQAQQRQLTEGNLEGGIGFMLAFPQGEFKQNVNKTGIGLGLNFAYLFRPFPFSIGAEGAYIMYGHTTRKAPWSETIPDVTVDVETSNNIAQIHLFLRLQPNEGPVRPYIDGLVGLNYLWTETSVKSERRLSSGEDIATSTNKQDMAFSYGGGGGIKVRVHENVTDEGRPLSVLIDLRLRYLVGGKAEYLKEGSGHIVNGKVYYDVYTSTTDLLSGQIGVSVVF